MLVVLYCIVMYLQPVLNPKSYDGARVLEASGRPWLVKGRSYVDGSIQEVKVPGTSGRDNRVISCSNRNIRERRSNSSRRSVLNKRRNSNISRRNDGMSRTRGRNDR